MNTKKHMSKQAESALMIAAGFGGCDLTAADSEDFEGQMQHDGRGN